MPRSIRHLLWLVAAGTIGCAESTTEPPPATPVVLTIQIDLMTSAGDTILGVGFYGRSRADRDTSWTTLTGGGWSVSGNSSTMTLRESLGPEFHGWLRLILNNDESLCPAFLPDTLTVRYDQPNGVENDTVLIAHTLTVLAPTSDFRPGEHCATSTGLGVQAWFIVDSVSAITDSTFGRFTIGFLTTSADYDGHFKGALQDSVLVLDLAGDSPTYCPSGGLARLPQHPDGTFGVMSLSPRISTPYCDYLFQGGSLLFVPNPGIPWF